MKKPMKCRAVRASFEPHRLQDDRLAAVYELVVATEQKALEKRNSRADQDSGPKRRTRKQVIA